MKNDIGMPVAHGQHEAYVVWSLAYTFNVALYG